MRFLALVSALLILAGCGSSQKAQGQAADSSFNYVKLSVKVPSGEKIVASELHSLDLGTSPLASRKFDKKGSKEEFVDTLAQELAANTPLVAFFQMEDGSLWTSRLEGGEVLDGGGRSFKVEPVKFLQKSESSEIQSDYLQQFRLPIASGEYSGIARVKDEVYATVHDKGTGGGIHFFNIPMSTSGVIGQIGEKEAPGNASGPSGRDNEDIVYVPSSESLFVSSESDQQIREYTLEGTPTGRSLEIPEDMLEIQPNAGFEALAYDSAHGYFWAMTEKSLKNEGLHKQMLRLQRFSDKTLKPDARYLYMMGNPAVGDELVATAQSYVFGLSAMTTLEDGRIITLEREVYVPGGSVIEKALGAFTLSTLYVIDPLNDKSGILQKKLLSRVVTSAINLANYEGLCLGPKLSDDRQALLLLADSQNGMNGLTGEYIQVLVIKQ